MAEARLTAVSGPLSKSRNGFVVPDDPCLPESPEDPWTLQAFEVSLATGSLSALEGLSEDLDPAVLRLLLDGSTELEELALLRTCHRTELYLWAPSSWTATPLPGRVERFFASARRRTGDAAVRHLFRVAAGLESMAIGEREVREQVRAAGHRVVSRHARPVLGPLFRAAVAAAEEAAPEVPPSRSIAAIAATRILEESARPFPRVLVIGTGVVGREIAERLAAFARVALVYRSRPPEEAFLRETGARSAAWSALADELAVSDVVVTAVKTGRRTIGPETIEGRRTPLLAIDLGVPRNVDPELGRRPGVRLIDLEALRPPVLSPAPPEVVDRVDLRARQESRRLEAAGFERCLDAYRREVERIRRDLLAAAFPAGALEGSPEGERLDRFSRRLVARLLDPPTRRLRQSAERGEEERLRRWALALLVPPRPERE